MRALGSAKRRPALPPHREQRAHRRRHADAQRRHRRLDELHGVVDRHARRHHAAGRVDVHGDFLLGVLGLQEEKLGDDQRRHVVLDRTGDEDQALLEQPRVDVVGALAPVGLLDHHGDELHVGIDWVFHRNPSAARCRMRRRSIGGAAGFPRDPRQTRIPDSRAIDMACTAQPEGGRPTAVVRRAAGRLPRPASSAPRPWSACR